MLAFGLRWVLETRQGNAMTEWSTTWNESKCMNDATGFQKLVFGKVVTDKYSAMRTDELIFQCDCGAIHDPETTSFDKLCKSAHSVGWQIKWLDQGYLVHCPKCKI